MHSRLTSLRIDQPSTTAYRSTGGDIVLEHDRRSRQAVAIIVLCIDAICCTCEAFARLPSLKRGVFLCEHRTVAVRHKGCLHLVPQKGVQKGPGGVPEGLDNLKRPRCQDRIGRFKQPSRSAGPAIAVLNMRTLEMMTHQGM